MAQLQLTLPDPGPSDRWLVHAAVGRPVSREHFRKVVSANPDLRIERTADGELVIMAPAHSRTGRQNAELTRQLANWAIQNGEGTAFDSSAGFDLPNGANRSPDASWILNSRLDAISRKESEEYYPICPDFVIELRSTSDRLNTLQGKMMEYWENGTRLGWLVDPVKQVVFVYRPEKPVECLEKPESISGDTELPGFILTLDRIWI
jgi:Uma2 family endonuclease